MSLPLEAVTTTRTTKEMDESAYAHGERPSSSQGSFRKRRLSLPKHHVEAVHETARVLLGGDADADADADSNLKLEPSPLSNGGEKVVPETPPKGSLTTTTTTVAVVVADGKPMHPDEAESESDTLEPRPVEDEEEEEEETDEKAFTFRKRRLSLTNLLEHGKAEEAAAAATAAAKDRNTSSNTEPESDSAKRQRRLSVADSVATTDTGLGDELDGSSNNNNNKPRILHSVEMIAGPFAPPSPIHHHVLHQQNPLPPSRISALDDDLLKHSYDFTSDDFMDGITNGGSGGGGSSNSLMRRSCPRRRQSQRRRSSWKQRHHHIDEDKLPFPKHLVGTYSCHGVEPIYDSDCEGPKSQLPQSEASPDEEDEFSWGTRDDEQPGVASAAAAAVATGVPTAVHQSVGSGRTNVSHESSSSSTQPPPPQQQLVVASSSSLSISAKINQDRGGITFPYAKSNRTALFAVYDGHGQGGELVSQFALHEIQRRLQKHPSFGTDLERALRETFLAVDEALKDEPLIEPFFAGTTACVALLQNQTLTLANAGDSRAVLACRREDNTWQGINLTVDQNPDSPEEMERIVQSGGYVSRPPGPGLSARVWLDAEMTQIGLAMGRSIGDHAVSNVGVIADPVVTRYDLSSARNEFFILASDGVWEFLSSQEAVEIVASHLSRGATKACQALIEAAASRWHEEEGEYRDDITAIVVRLHDLWGGNHHHHHHNSSV